MVVPEILDEFEPWDYFDGMAQVELSVGCAGGILFFSETHFITSKAEIGTSTNNKAELLALKLILSLAIGRRVQNLHVIRDSVLIINWMRGLAQMQNILVKSLVQ